MGVGPWLILPKPQGGSGNRRKSRRGLVRWASDLSPNRFQEVFLFGLGLKRNESSQQWIRHGWSAEDTRGAADGRRSLKAVRAKTRRRRGSPTPTRQRPAGKSRKPQVPVETARHPVPARSSHSERATGPPMCERAEGSPGFQGRGYLEARGCNPSARLRAQGLPQAGAAALPGVRGVGSSERSRPGGRSSGARGDGSGHGESRAEAETLPGALDWGGGGYGAGVGGSPPFPAAGPPLHATGQSLAGGGPSGSHPPLSP